MDIESIKKELIEKIISHCVDDMNDLRPAMQNEQNKNLQMIWKYHYRLNQEIINNLLTGDYMMAAALLRELARSMREADCYIRIQMTTEGKKIDP